MTFKSSDVFKLDQAWWKKHKPLTVKSTGLGATINTYLAAKKAAVDFSKKGTWEGTEQKDDPLKGAMDILTITLPAAVLKAEKACSKHSDAVTYLRTAKNVLKAEHTALTKLQSDFAKRYGKVRGDLVMPAVLAVHENNIFKQGAHTLYKDAETAANDLITMGKSAAALTGQAAYKLACDAQSRFLELEEHLEGLKDLAESAQKEYKAVSGFSNQVPKLTDADAKAVLKNVDEAQKARNAIDVYRDKAAVFVQSGSAQLEKIASSGAGNQTQMTAAEAKDRIGKLVDSLFKVKESGRAISNTLVAYLQNLTLAEQNLETAAKTLRMDVADLPVYCREALLNGPKLQDKITKLHGQFHRMKKSVMKTIPPALLNDPAVAKKVVKLQAESADMDVMKSGMDTKRADCDRRAKVVIGLVG